MGFDGANVLFRDVPADYFPMKIEFFRKCDGMVVHVIEVPGPGAVHVPGLKDEHGTCGCRVTLGNGQVITDDD